jgi:hypothetical protein
MPARKTHCAAIKVMEARVEALEADLLGVKTTLSNLEKNQEILIVMMEKSLCWICLEISVT